MARSYLTAIVHVESAGLPDVDVRAGPEDAVA
jgi:hypothetical protein